MREIKKFWSKTPIIGDLLQSSLLLAVYLIKKTFEFYRKVEQKPSQTYYELQKRQLKGVNEIKIVNRNPIVEGDFDNQPPGRIRQVH